jgi:integrase
MSSFRISAVDSVPAPTGSRKAWQPKNPNVVSIGPAMPSAPGEELTVADFVERVFVPEHVNSKRLAGRIHYQAILKHVLTPGQVGRIFEMHGETVRSRLSEVTNWPYVGHVRLSDFEPNHVQRLLEAALQHGYSTQTVKHIRSVVSAIFECARRKRSFAGENPAAQIALPGMVRKEAHELTLAQAKEVIRSMRYPEREMALLMILTSMNVAEVCGLQWKYVNLGDTWSQETDSVPPRSIAVRNQWYRGQLTSVNLASRSRTLPIPVSLIPVLAALRRRASFTGPDDFVLVSAKGKPISEKNIAVRRLKSIGETLCMPWLSWHVFRRSRRSLLFELGMKLDSLTGTPANSAAISADPSCETKVAGLTWTGAFWMRLAPVLRASFNASGTAAGLHAGPSRR